MVSICLEYVSNMADYIYIYGSNEFGQYSTDVFYQINNIIVKKHKVNDAVSETSSNSRPVYDISKERQATLLNILNKDLREISDLCKNNNREMPTEMKLTYDVSNNKLDVQYSYEIKYTNDPEKLPSHIFNDWFEEMGGKL